MVGSAQTYETSTSNNSQFFTRQNKITAVLNKHFVSNTAQLQSVDRTIPSSEHWMPLVTVASGELLSAAVQRCDTAAVIVDGTDSVFRP